MIVIPSNGNMSRLSSQQQPDDPLVPGGTLLLDTHLTCSDFRCILLLKRSGGRPCVFLPRLRGLKLAFQATLEVEPTDKLLSVTLRIILMIDPLDIQSSEG